MANSDSLTLVPMNSRSSERLSGHLEASQGREAHLQDEEAVNEAKLEIWWL